MRRRSAGGRSVPVRRVRKAVIRGLAALALLMLFACVSDDSSSEVVRFDSAGIEIVQGEGGNPSLKLGPATLQVGQMHGDDPYVLGHPIGSARLGSGALVVLDALGYELRWFNPDGAHIRTRGREGEGPGEFSNPVALLRIGDSVGVYDQRLSRMTLFDSAGALARTWRVEGPSGGTAPDIAWHSPAPFGRLDDGRFLHLSSRSPARTGLVRRMAVVVATSSTGEWLGPLLEFSGDDVVVEEIAGGMRQQRFSPGTGHRKASAATDGRFIYVGNGDSYDIAVYTPDGTLLRILRRSHEPVPADDAQLERLMAELRRGLAELPAVDRMTRQRVLATGRANFAAALARFKYIPAYGALESDASGRLWVARTNSDELYDVLATDGRLLGTLTLPGEPLFFGQNEVIVRQESESGVPRVVLVPVLNPAASDATTDDEAPGRAGSPRAGGDSGIRRP